MLQVRSSRGKGRGIFTTSPIYRGELIHIAPVIVLTEDEIGQTLDLYIYTFGEVYALALGLGSLFNHSQYPTISFIRDFERKEIKYYAERNIVPDEELTIDYGYQPPGYVETNLKIGRA
jgi:hypothetical protein